MNKNYIKKNVTVIIRTVGERTTSLCHELIKKQVPEKNIHIISETPFTEAVRKTFEVGLRENRKWTFVVDADVLIKPGVIEEIVDYAETVDEKVFKIEGKIIDKFLESPREAGTHLYRTSQMKHALNFIPDPYEAIRPETYVRNEMNAIGFSFIKTNILTGLHDFEQYYKDIYRKCFIQAKKHKERVLKILSDWEKMACCDKDYKIAIAGFNAGLDYNGEISIDSKANFMDGFDELINHSFVREKDEYLKHDSYSDDIYLLFIKKVVRKIEQNRHNIWFGKKPYILIVNEHDISFWEKIKIRCFCIKFLKGRFNK